MLIDTHAHVNFAAFKDDADFAIKRALEEGTWVVNVGTQIDTSKAAVAMAEKYGSGVFSVVGLHPVHTYSQNLDEEESSFTTREEKFDYEAYKQLASHPKVVGIGECGLDYYRLPEIADLSSIKNLQRNAFVSQIKLARELNKTLVIHCRPSIGTQDAYEDVLKILDEELPHLTSPLKGEELFRFEIHSFTGNVETVQEFLKRGAYVGLNGIITFDKTGNMEKVVQAVPLDRIVLETDCPYLGPIPYRGKRNEPAYVKYVAQEVAKLKSTKVEEVAEQTSENAKKLFRLS